jgi:hypothetical protein
MEWHIERRLVGLRQPADTIYAYLTNPDNTPEALGPPFCAARRLDRSSTGYQEPVNGMQAGERYECRCELALPGLSRISGAVELEVTHARPPHEVGVRARRVTDLRISLPFMEIVHPAGQIVHAEAHWEIRERVTPEGMPETLLILRTRGSVRGLPFLERLLTQHTVERHVERILRRLGCALMRATPGARAVPGAVPAHRRAG